MLLKIIGSILVGIPIIGIIIGLYALIGWKEMIKIMAISIVMCAITLSGLYLLTC